MKKLSPTCGCPRPSLPNTGSKCILGRSSFDCCISHQSDSIPSFRFLPSLQLFLSHLILPPLASILREITPSAPRKAKYGEPYITYQQREGKSNLVQKQPQASESEESTDSNSFNSDSSILDTFDLEPVDLHVAFRKRKRSCA